MSPRTAFAKSTSVTINSTQGSVTFPAIASLKLSLTSGPPTSKVKVNGTGFGISETATFTFDTTSVGSTTTSSKGTFSKTITAPTSAQPGNHTITARGLTSGSQASKRFLVQTSWSQFHWGAGRIGNNPYENVVSASNASNLSLDWLGPTSGGVSSSPAVVKGVVYVGSDDGKLYAFKEGCGSGGASCIPLWTSTVIGRINDSSPAVVNGVIYVEASPLSQNGYNFNLYAFNAAGCGNSTCAPLWTGALGTLPASGPVSSPAVVNGVVYIGGVDNVQSSLYAFNAAGCGSSTCSPLWTGPTGSILVGTPTVANGAVYVGAGDGKLYAFNAAGCGSSTCTPLWTSASIGTTGGSAPAVTNGAVYINAGDLYVFNAAGCGSSTCSPLWIGSIGTSGNSSSPAVANGAVYLGASNGKLYTFNAAGCGSSTCSPLWIGSGTFPENTVSSPAVANGVVYLGDVSDALYAFNAAGCGSSTCSPLWTGWAANSIDSSPAVANGVIYVGSLDDKLYAFHLPGHTP